MTGLGYRRALCLALSMAAPAASAHAQTAGSPPTRAHAHQVVARALAAMGGESLLSRLVSLHFDARQVDYRIDDSERDADPWWVRLRTIDEVRDIASDRFRQEVTLESAQFAQGRFSIIDDGRIQATENGSSWSTRPSSHDRIALGPERILLTAANAKDLREGDDQPVYGVNHHRLLFTWNHFPVTVFINADSYLPDRIELTRTDPYDLAQSAWGDVTWRTDFLFWKREPDGLYYPRQWNVFRDGQPSSVYEIMSLTENQSLPAQTFALSADAQRQFEQTGHLTFAEKPLGTGGANVLEPIGENIWLLAGNWNVVVARQSDGLVIIECPQSSAYSAKVLAYVADRFPSVPVKAVISTTDALWHFAGVRTVVARGIPVYALDLTLPLLHSFLDAPHTFEPDELALHPRAADLRAVSAKTIIGSGSTRIEIYPIRGNGDERMLMVYFPEQHLLYGSSNDVIVRGAATLGTFNLPEIVTAVRRLGLSVDSYVAIHTAKMPWSTVTASALRASLN